MVDISTSSPSNRAHTTLDCGAPPGLIVVITTNTGAWNNGRTLAGSASPMRIILPVRATAYFPSRFRPDAPARALP
jgi:hypothetical protein